MLLITIQHNTWYKENNFYSKRFKSHPLNACSTSRPPPDRPVIIKLQFHAQSKHPLLLVDAALQIQEKSLGHELLCRLKNPPEECNGHDKMNAQQRNQYVELVIADNWINVSCILYCHSNKFRFKKLVILEISWRPHPCWTCLANKVIAKG